MSDQEDSNSFTLHTLHMRRAVGDIREGLKKLRAKTASEDGNAFAPIMIGHGGNHNKYIQELFQSTQLASERFQEERGDGLKDVHQRFRICCNDNDLPIDTVYPQNDGSSWHANNSAKDPINNCGDLSPTVRAENGAYQFKQQFCIRNVPCIIRGLDNSHFADVSTQWRSEIRHSVDSSSVDDIGLMNVKYHSQHYESNSNTTNDVQSGYLKD